jgi:hypothetical protein
MMNLVAVEITILIEQLVRALRRAKTDDDRRIFNDRLRALTSEYERALNAKRAPDA